uniref:HAT C-terminal dimerisation domain-containing protein n=1 Tax=Ditylenchus dipsaci TaxID=166011 RepID=A0A915DCX5_9BILA
MSFIMLAEKEVNYDAVVELTIQIAPEIAEDDALFNEVSELNHLLQCIPDEIFAKDSAEEKWMKIFQGNDTLPNLFKVISIVMSIQVANAFVERVFSLCGAQWTKDRNSLEPETVKALLQVRVIFDLACPDMFHLLMKNSALRDQICGQEKYE